MNCFQCKGRLSDKDICPKCGADNSMYRKIIYTSNSYYNAGLMKAKARNLSGATESLRFCLQMNKENIQARNLLGLVYYEMGDADLAIREWSISQTMMPQNNPAETYIRELVEDSDKINTYNNVVHIFNQSLESIKSGAEDIAIAKLKKVIAINPGFLKAYQLISLLYVKRDEYDKAEAILNRCLEADQGNIVALTYLSELNRAKQKKNKKVGVAGRQDYNSGMTGGYILPFFDLSSYVVSVICILVGFFLGWGVLNYVQKPMMEEQAAQRQEVKIQEYQDIIQSLNGQLNDKSNENDKLTDENKRLEEELEEIFSAQATGNIEKYMNEGMDFFKKEKYEEALESFRLASVIKSEEAAPAFWIAECYQMLGRTEEAITQYRFILTKFKDSEYFEQCAFTLANLLGTTKEDILSQYRKQ